MCNTNSNLYIYTSSVYPLGVGWRSTIQRNTSVYVQYSGIHPTISRIYTFTHHPCIHQVWDGGFILSEYISLFPEKVQGRRCVEVGAGTGSPPKFTPATMHSKPHNPNSEAGVARSALA